MTEEVSNTVTRETVTSDPCDPKPGKKKIVICCDGTGNEFGQENSNVVKLYTALEIDNRQVGYYHPGVGTMGDPGARHWVARKWSVIKGLAFASGFADNVLDAYRYLMGVYDDGDEVYIFGFSRGAYSARALAGLLDGYGLLCRGNEGHLPYAWRLYLAQHEERDRRSIDPHDVFAEAFKETFSHKEFKIHFLGLWDTVSSVGWISTPLRLFNVAQNPTVEIGRHAVSIDERRCFYLDNLWGDPFLGQDLMQVWFAGVHSDVGGSYPQNESVLSNIALEWMFREADHAGVLLKPDRVRLVLGEHTEAYPYVRPLYKKPKCSIVHKSLRGIWWILELLPHIYFDKDNGVEQRRIPLGAHRQLPCGALIHPSVKERIEQRPDYKPKNLDLKDGTLTPVENPTPVTPLLFAYTPPNDDKSSAFVRYLLLTVFSAVEIVLALVLLLLIVKGWLWLWHHHQVLTGAIAHGYRALGALIKNRVSRGVWRVLFPKSA